MCFAQSTRQRFTENWFYFESDTSTKRLYTFSFISVHVDRVLLPVRGERCAKDKLFIHFVYTLTHYTIDSPPCSRESHSFSDVAFLPFCAVYQNRNVQFAIVGREGKLILRHIGKAYTFSPLATIESGESERARENDGELFRFRTFSDWKLIAMIFKYLCQFVRIHIWCG